MKGLQMFAIKLLSLTSTPVCYKPFIQCLQTQDRHRKNSSNPLSSTFFCCLPCTSSDVENNYTWQLNQLEHLPCFNKKSLVQQYTGKHRFQYQSSLNKAEKHLLQQNKGVRTTPADINFFFRTSTKQFKWNNIHKDNINTQSHTSKCTQKCMVEKSQWKWLWISWGLSYSILTQGGAGGLSGEAGLTWEGRKDAALEGVISALRLVGCRVVTGGRVLVEMVVLLVLLLSVWAWDKSWELACEDSGSPRVKNEGGGRVAAELAGKAEGHWARWWWMAVWVYKLPHGYDWYAAIPPKKINKLPTASPT